MANDRNLAEAVHPPPVGASTAARLAVTVAEVGFDALVLRGTDEESVSAPAIVEQSGVDLVCGIEIDDGAIETISGQLPHLHTQTPLLMVAGGSEARNRFVASQADVDVLTRPIGPNGPDLDPGIASDAVANDVAIELDLGPLRRREGGKRVRYIDRLRRLYRLIEHYEVPYVLTMSPSSHLEVVSPRAIGSLAELVGIDHEAATAGLATWHTIATRNADRVGEGFFSTQTQADPNDSDDR